MATIEEIHWDIVRERVRQDDKWGGELHDDMHTMADWTLFMQLRLDKLGNGVGDAAAARSQLIEVAALAVAAIESLDRKVILAAGPKKPRRKRPADNHSATGEDDA